MLDGIWCSLHHARKLLSVRQKKNYSNHSMFLFQAKRAMKTTAARSFLCSPTESPFALFHRSCAERRSTCAIYSFKKKTCSFSGLVPHDSLQNPRVARRE